MGLSSTDTLAAGFLGVAGVVIGILFDRQLRAGERTEARVNQIVLLADRVESQLAGLLTHIGLNEDVLIPLLAENLEGKSPTKADFHRLVNDAISAYPIPDPEQVPFPEDDPYGYALAAISNETSNYVREANAAAEKLKSGTMDVDSVSNFVVLNDRAVSKDIIMKTAETQFKEFLDTVAELQGRKVSTEERNEAVKKLIADLEKTYSLAVKQGESMKGYRDHTADYLRRVGW